MSRPLFNNFGMIARKIQGAANLLIGLDYDGTLTPIVNDPSQAVLDPEVKKLLKRLALRPNTHLAIVSGRGLADVRRRVDLDGIVYAGNHGLEITGPDRAFVEPDAARKSVALRYLAPRLLQELGSVAGVIVEDKGLTIAIHCRQVASGDKDLVIRHVEAAVAALPDGFQLGRGHEVLEVRPRVDWDKGLALRWIANNPRKEGLLTVFVGDDQTDEDAFGVLEDGITVKVGNHAMTQARYHVEGTEGVARFLASLGDIRK